MFRRHFVSLTELPFPPQLMSLNLLLQGKEKKKKKDQFLRVIAFKPWAKSLTTNSPLLILIRI